MMYATVVLALASSVTATVYQGFNYGSTLTDGTAKSQQYFENEFANAKQLVGASGFTSARLYTMIQSGAGAQDPILAIPAAISQQTTLLLGMWASAGQDAITNEIAALNNAISTYGSKFTDLVVGLSIGSEDLYRASAVGQAANAGVGADASVVAGYITQVRKALANTDLDNVPIGHVDTWTAWVDGSNAAVVSACDWIGMDAYPYFQTTMANDISVAGDLFFEALANTTAAASGKSVWITETGWPVSGPNENLAVASVENAKKYWDQVACKTLGKYNTWWYTLQDAQPTTPSPSFGLVGSTLTTTPLYDLTCPAVSSSSSSATSSSTSSTSKSASASATKSGSSSTSSSVSSISIPSVSATLGPVVNQTAVVTGAPTAAVSTSSAVLAPYGNGTTTTGSKTSTLTAPLATGAASAVSVGQFAVLAIVAVVGAVAL